VFQRNLLSVLFSLLLQLNQNRQGRKNLGLVIEMISACLSLNKTELLKDVALLCLKNLIKLQEINYGSE
jgi:hypothetical protein